MFELLLTVSSWSIVTAWYLNEKGRTYTQPVRINDFEVETVVTRAHPADRSIVGRGVRS